MKSKSGHSFFLKTPSSDQSRHFYLISFFRLWIFRSLDLSSHFSFSTFLCSFEWRAKHVAENKVQRTFYLIFCSSQYSSFRRQKHFLVHVIFNRITCQRMWTHIRVNAKRSRNENNKKTGKKYEQMGKSFFCHRIHCYGIIIAWKTTAFIW